MTLDIAAGWGKVESAEVGNLDPIPIPLFKVKKICTRRKCDKYGAGWTGNFLSLFQHSRDTKERRKCEI